MGTMVGEREVALVPAEETGMVSTFERLARDPSVDVEKLKELVLLQERGMARQAKAAYNASFVAMQAVLPEITEKGQIKVGGTVRSTYAKLEDIHAQIRPILNTHGFAIRHRTEWPADKPGIIRIVGILSHRDGHSEESAFEAPMDTSQYRTDIQSMGSTVSYGRRYTTLDLLNITTRGMDNDGQAAKPEPPKAPPEGFAQWRLDMEAVCDEGFDALSKAWKASKVEFRDYLRLIEPDAVNTLKAKANTKGTR